MHSAHFYITRLKVTFGNSAGLLEAINDTLYRVCCFSGGGTRNAQTAIPVANFMEMKFDSGLWSNSSPNVSCVF